ncbi:MAG TPA: NTP transferase domain-containing protein, partial [Bacteroidales bacterium]|nr:NTP transferase domain-containing protein [Bacteroidales bacterium]
MQAIILAAGMGKRLGDLTKNNTKCMIKVNGITLIERLLTQLDNLNLSKIIL